MVILTISVLTGGLILLGQSSSNDLSISSGKAVVVEKDYSFGNVKMSSGNVVKKFIIKNSGSEILKLTNVKTSCHCTTASISIENKKSPSFGMSGFSSWIGEVKPGTLAELEVIFDPAFHGPNGVGQINRFISVETSDPKNQKLTFSLNGFVTQ